MNLLANAEATDSNWNWLYKVGSVSALGWAVLLPLQIVIFILWQAKAFEGTVADWYRLFQSNSLIGLLSLDFGIIVEYVLLIPILLALYVALKPTSASFTAIGLIVGLVGITTYFASNTAFNMLYLSNRYAVASTNAERTAILAAGNGMLAIFEGTAFHLSYFLVSVALIILPAVMLRSNVFSKATAYIGLISSLAGFGLYVPVIGDYIAILSVVGLEIWFVLIALRLFKLGRDEQD